MVKGGKDFKRGLDAIIQNTRVSEEPEISSEAKAEEKPKGKPKAKAPEKIKETAPVIPAMEPVKETKKEPVKEKERQITLTLPQSFRREIKQYCAKNDITIKELIIKSVEQYMKGE
jgi:hypothetical protein